MNWLHQQVIFDVCDFKNWASFKCEMSSYKQYIKIKQDDIIMILEKNNTNSLQYKESLIILETRWISIIANILGSSIVRIISRFVVEVALSSIPTYILFCHEIELLIESN